MATATQPQHPEVVEERARPIAPPSRRSRRRLWPLLGLTVGALVFLFPFYYMVIGALQREPNSDVSGAFPNPANLTLDNLRDIDRAIDLPRTLLNSGIFTVGVLLSTLVLGLLAGYALARLEFRGRGAVFSAMLLILIVPFQLLMIPLYVMIVRNYGLADSYLGMILPFAVNATAVFIFRQFFLQLPRELFESARLDGASELKILTRIAIPLAKPAILTAVIVTFIGPWNEFLWPFLVTKQLALQPLAVALANFISTVAARQANPFGAILAGAVVLAVPAVVLFLVFQRHFRPPTSAPRSRDDEETDPFAAAGWTARRLGVVMAPTRTTPRGRGVCNPACARGPDGELYLFPRLVAEGNYSRVGLARVRFDGGVPTGVERLGVALEPRRRGSSTGAAAGRGPTDHLRAHPRPLRHDLHRLGAARAADRPGHLERPGAVGAAGAGRLRLRPRPAGRPQPVPQQGRAAVPRAGARPGRRACLRPAPPADLGPVVGQPGRGRAPPPGLPDPRPGIWVSFVPAKEVLAGSAA